MKIIEEVVLPEIEVVCDKCFTKFSYTLLDVEDYIKSYGQIGSRRTPRTHTVWSCGVLCPRCEKRIETGK